MEKDCTITSSSPYSFPAGFGADALQQEHYRSPTNVRTLTPNSNEQRQGIIMAMVSCLLLFLTAYGILGLVQQIGIQGGSVMRTEKKSHRSRMDPIVALVLIFAVLKVTGLISWSWLWVFSPIWITLLFFAAIFSSILVGGRIVKGKW